MKTRTKVHFTVDFGGLTNRVREFWAEGKYAHAMRVLEEGCNITGANASLVLNGRLKLAQDPNGTKGCDGRLEPDSWTPMQSRFLFYPDATCPVTAAECGRLWKENAELRERLQAFEEGCVVPPEDSRTLAEIHRDFDPAIAIRSDVQRLGSALLKNQLSLSDRPTPKPDTTYESGNGWVLPNGRFYPCENTMEHIWLAGRLGKSEEGAEELGWVKLAKPILGTYVVSQKKPTQAQINTVFAWADKKPNRETPAKEWLERWNTDETP